MKLLLFLALFLSPIFSFCQPSHARLMERMEQGIRTSHRMITDTLDTDILMDTAEMNVLTIRLHAYADSSEYFAERMVVVRKENGGHVLLHDADARHLNADDLEWKAIQRNGKVYIRLINKGKRKINCVITRMKGY